ncbi:hypothetical protein J6590_009380 [Homalodisca vitripennis]|nr:hypothetical protein J6590_009380 [Homalodisca vitripennis]
MSLISITPRRTIDSSRITRANTTPVGAHFYFCSQNRKCCGPVRSGPITLSQKINESCMTQRHDSGTADVGVRADQTG